MDIKYIKNSETGVVFKYDEYMLSLPGMIPCDEKGNAIDLSKPKRTRRTKPVVDVKPEE